MNGKTHDFMKENTIATVTKNLKQKLQAKRDAYVDMQYRFAIGTVAGTLNKDVRAEFPLVALVEDGIPYPLDLSQA